ncbi:MAG: alpha/beta hydrolase [Luteolibacter sp.]
MFRDDAVSPISGLHPTAATHLRDIDYGGNGDPSQTLDLILPPPRGGAPRPVVVYIHGGSWDSGEKEDGLTPLSLLATGDFVLATINYRLTGEACWPAQLEDAEGALRYLREHATSYGIDPERIAVIGVSAGGHLAGMLGTSPSRGLRCVISFFAPANFLTLVGNPESLEPQEAEAAARIFGPVEDLVTTARQASPVNRVGPDAVPFLLIHGTADQVVPFSQSEEMHAALQQAGAESTLIPEAGAGHGFFSPALLEPILAFLSHHLLEKPAEIRQLRAG